MLLADKVRQWAAEGGGLFAYEDPAAGAVTYQVCVCVCVCLCVCVCVSVSVCVCLPATLRACVPV